MKAMKIYEASLTYNCVGTSDSDCLDSPKKIVSYLEGVFDEDPTVEYFIAIPFNRKNRPLARIIVSKGTASSCLVHPREVFKPAILASACAIAVAHNHPSGDPAPSRADFKVTSQLREAANDKRGSDTRTKQGGFDWMKPDTRALDSAIGTGRVNEAQLPWNRAATHGTKALSDHELLYAIVGNVASDLLFEAGSFAGLAKWSMAQLETFKGIGRKKAAALASIFEINKRTEEGHRPSYCDPDAVHRLLTPECITLETEHFFVLLLDRKNQLIKKITVGTGTASSCLVHPREVFRDAIFHSASAIIVAHNHPSGDPSPSRADIKVTRQLREAAKVIGIDLIDHIVIGAKQRDPHGIGYYSFNEAGLI